MMNKIVKFAVRLEDSVIYVPVLAVIWIVSTMVIYEATHNNTISQFGGVLTATVIFLGISSLSFSNAIRVSFYKKQEKRKLLGQRRI